MPEKNKPFEFSFTMFFVLQIAKYFECSFFSRNSKKSCFRDRNLDDVTSLLPKEKVSVILSYRFLPAYLFSNKNIFFALCLWTQEKSQLFLELFLCKYTKTYVIQSISCSFTREWLQLWRSVLQSSWKIIPIHNQLVFCIDSSPYSVSVYPLWVSLSFLLIIY